MKDFEQQGLLINSVQSTKQIMEKYFLILFLSKQNKQTPWSGSASKTTEQLSHVGEVSANFCG
jgi:glutathione synthase/RimK-type ligase-like ATP-grasp enzyme